MPKAPLTQEEQTDPPPTKHFSVDARALLTLGRESIKDHTTALIELVKNSYDADASLVEVELSRGKEDQPSFIRVADNGTGMTESDIDAYWLRIGFSHKAADRLTRSKRRRTGEKGIGRLSADRLGAHLALRTKARHKTPLALAINWDKFSAPGQSLETIPVAFGVADEIKLPGLADVPPASASGTELICTQLRDAWTAEDVRNLHEELALLTPPLSEPTGFSIVLTSDIAPDLNGTVTSSLADASEVELEAEFDGASEVSFRTRTRSTTGEQLDSKTENLSWEQLTQAPNKEAAPPKLGPVRVHLMFFVRKAEALRGTTLSLAALREFLELNAGIKIYRDNIRVKPYGGPKSSESDWLKLGERKARDPAGAGRSTFRAGPNQIVGAVHIGRDTNPSLTDSSAREGLVNNKAFEELKRFVMACVTLLEGAYHKAFTTGARAQETQNPLKEITELKSDLKGLAETLAAARKSTPKTSNRNLERSMDQINLVIEQIKTKTPALERLASQVTVYRGLATVGIAATVFGHETQSSISQFVSSVNAAKILLTVSPPEVEDTIPELDKAIESARKVASWGSFALTRVKRDKRRMKNLDVDRLLKDLAEDIRPVFKASQIDLEISTTPVSGRGFAMDLEAVALNLLTNAYAACQQTNKKRLARLQVKPTAREGTNGVSIIVSDSGPGVPTQYLERIWEPLFSTKTTDGHQTGTGLGLAIIQSIIEELGGHREADKDPQLKGARFSIWLPLK